MSKEDQRIVELDEEVPVVGIMETDGSISEVEDELLAAKAEQIVEDLPAKFKGKQLGDVVSMYENLEKELGRKGQEIGDLRKMTDTLLQRDIEAQRLSELKPKESEPEIDFFDDPEAAVARILDQKLKPLQDSVGVVEKDKFYGALEESGIKYKEITKDREFFDWVGTSPYRMKMWEDADGYDIDAAKELFGMWELKNPSPAERESLEEVVELGKEARDKNLDAAATETGATKGASRKKVFRRLDLIRLKINDPDKYRSLEAEIVQAYIEGRVK